MLGFLADFFKTFSPSTGGLSTFQPSPTGNAPVEFTANGVSFQQEQQFEAIKHDIEQGKYSQEELEELKERIQEAREQALSFRTEVRVRGTDITVPSPNDAEASSAFSIAYDAVFNKELLLQAQQECNQSLPVEVTSQTQINFNGFAHERIISQNNIWQNGQFVMTEAPYAQEQTEGFLRGPGGAFNFIGANIYGQSCVPLTTLLWQKPYSFPCVAVTEQKDLENGNVEFRGFSFQHSSKNYAVELHQLTFEVTNTPNGPTFELASDNDVCSRYVDTSFMVQPIAGTTMILTQGDRIPVLGIRKWVKGKDNCDFDYATVETNKDNPYYGRISPYMRGHTLYLGNPYKGELEVYKEEKEEGGRIYQLKTTIDLGIGKCDDIKITPHGKDGGHIIVEAVNSEKSATILVDTCNGKNEVVDRQVHEGVPPLIEVDLTNVKDTTYRIEAQAKNATHLELNVEQIAVNSEGKLNTACSTTEIKSGISKGRGFYTRSIFDEKSETVTTSVCSNTPYFVDSDGKEGCEVVDWKMPPVNNHSPSRCGGEGTMSKSEKIGISIGVGLTVPSMFAALAYQFYKYWKPEQKKDTPQKKEEQFGEKVGKEEKKTQKKEKQPTPIKLEQPQKEKDDTKTTNNIEMSEVQQKPKEKTEFSNIKELQAQLPDTLKDMPHSSVKNEVATTSSNTAKPNDNEIPPLTEHYVGKDQTGTGNKPPKPDYSGSFTPTPLYGNKFEPNLTPAADLPKKDQATWEEYISERFEKNKSKEKLGEVLKELQESGPKEFDVFGRKITAENSEGHLTLTPNSDLTGASGFGAFVQKVKGDPEGKVTIDREGFTSKKKLTEFDDLMVSHIMDEAYKTFVGKINSGQKCSETIIN